MTPHRPIARYTHSPHRIRGVLAAVRHAGRRSAGEQVIYWGWVAAPR